MRDMISEGTQTFSFPVCNDCKNFIEDAKCKAFDRIPSKILAGIDGHLKPLPEQKNDIVFEEIK